MTKILVCGGAGFLGKNFIATLLTKQNIEVFSFDLSPCSVLPDDKNIIGNMLNSKDVEDAISLTNASIVCSFAGIADIEDCAANPVSAIEANVLGPTIIMKACADAKVNRLIFASSVYASTNLGGFYKSTKLACESLLKDFQRYYGLNYTILRYGTLYGRGSNSKNSIYRFLEQALENGMIKYQGDGYEKREYIHVLDAAELTYEAMKSSYENKTLVLTGQNTMQVNDLFNMISEILGKEILINYEDPQYKNLLKSHYKTTPYSYVKDMSRKLVQNEYIDLGRGLLDCIEEIENDRS